MSRDRSAFSSLAYDWRPLRLADGKLVYSEGVGRIHFLSACGFVIAINDVLFVPSLASNLFSPNRFARDHRSTHSEVTEYPVRKWINRQTGAVEFTATIKSDDLAYLDWRPTHSVDSASISIVDLHTRLNHMPFPSVRQLVRANSIAGIPDHITDTSAGEFCEDCQRQADAGAPYKACCSRRTSTVSGLL